MPYSDPEKMREYQRNYKREQRAKEVIPVKKTTFNPEQIATAKGLLVVLADTITEVVNADADVFIRARCIGYLVGVGLRAVEVADLESRLTALEACIESEYKKTH